MSCSEAGCGRRVVARGLCPTHYSRWRRNGGETRKKGEPMEFILRALASSTDECIVWPFARHGKGYGHVKWSGAVRKAHRVVCELAHGEPPTEMHEAAHAPFVCNNRACINPRHLRWATPVENISDRQNGMTHAHGETHSRAVLTEADVREIRKEKVGFVGDLARRFGVSEATIRSVLGGATWKHVG
jgi:hypothetical protein